MVILEYDDANLLMATGTYACGFMLSHHDGDKECEYHTDVNQPITVPEVIKIFQAYARGEDWGRSTFKWERVVVDDKISHIIKRLVILGFFGYLIYVVVRNLVK